MWEQNCDLMGFFGGKYLETYGQCVRLLPYEKRIQLYVIGAPE
jgi:hypothetical protein